MRNVLAVALWASPITLLGCWGWWQWGKPWFAVLTLVLAGVALWLLWLDSKDIPPGRHARK